MSNKAVNINAISANAMTAFAPPAAGQSTLPAAYATALPPVWRPLGSSTGAETSGQLLVMGESGLWRDRSAATGDRAQIFWPACLVTWTPCPKLRALALQCRASFKNLSKESDV